MDKGTKQNILDDWQDRIDNLPYASTIPYPYCCVCFDQLTADNVTTDGDSLVNVCKECHKEQ